MATEYKAGLRITGTNTDRTTDFAVSSWSSIADLPETRVIHFMAGGNKSSAIQTQGSKNGSDRYKDTTYLWNGSAWSTGNSNTVSKDYASGGGTTSGAISVMGYSGSAHQSTQKYNGSTWSDAGNTGNSFYNTIADGNDSYAIQAQGTIGGSNSTNNASTYNGSSWSSITDTGGTGYGGQGGGTSSNFHIAGSYNPSGNINNAEKWNGSAWSTTSNSNTPRKNGQGGGNSSSGYISGGNDGSNSIAKAESWDGSSWTNKESMPEEKTGASHTSTGSLTTSGGAIQMAGNSGSSGSTDSKTCFVYTVANPVNLQEGTVFEEIDTGSHFVWYGGTWVEI